MNDDEGKAILRRWPDTTSLFRWRGDRRVLKAHPPSPFAQLLTLGSTASSTYADGAYVNLQPPDDEGKSAIADVLFIEVCGSSQNLSDKRSRYLPTHESRALKLTKNWFEKRIRWSGGGVIPIHDALGIASPDKDTYAPIRALRVLYVIEDNLFLELREGEIPRGYEFFASDSWFRSTVPNWPKDKPDGGWTTYEHTEPAFPTGDNAPRNQARRFFDLNQHFLGSAED